MKKGTSNGEEVVGRGVIYDEMHLHVDGLTRRIIELMEVEVKEQHEYFAKKEAVAAEKLEEVVPCIEIY
ncbi:hypothetical protein COE51_06360 [Bacillus pseudomycoides]|nr:hypothetical protein COE51_06360 [Bacillus pseudomycoides]